VQTESFESFSAYSSGLDAYDSGMVDEASEFMEQAIEIDPRFDKAYEKLDIIEEKLEDISKKAAEISQQVSEVDTKVSIGFEKLEASIEDLLNPSDYIKLTDSFIQNVKSIMKTDDYQQAKILLDESLTIVEKRKMNREVIAKLVPNTDLGYFSRAYLASDSGDKKTSISLLDTALAINPEFILAYINRASDNDDFESKIEDLHTAVSIDKNTSMAFWSRAVAYYNNNNRYLASLDFEKVVEIETSLEKYNFIHRALYQLMVFSDIPKGCDYYNDLLRIEKEDKENFLDQSNYEKWYAEHIYNSKEWHWYDIDCMQSNNKIHFSKIKNNTQEYQYKEIRLNVLVLSVGYIGSTFNDPQYISLSTYTDEERPYLSFNKTLFNDKVHELQNTDRKYYKMTVTAKVIPNLHSYNDEISLGGLDVTSYAIGWESEKYEKWFNENYGYNDDGTLYRHKIRDGFLSDNPNNNIDITKIKYNIDKLQGKQIKMEIPIIGKSYNYGGRLSGHIENYIELYTIDKESNEKYFFYFNLDLENEVNLLIDNNNNIKMIAEPIKSDEYGKFNNQFEVMYFEHTDVFDQWFEVEYDNLPDGTITDSYSYTNFANQINNIVKQHDWEAWIQLLIEKEALFYYNYENLNSFAWHIATEPSLIKFMNKAKEWSKRSIEIKKSPHLLDTYAHILFKLKDYNMAQKIEQEAIDLLREYNYPDSVIVKYEEDLLKFKKY